MLFRIEDVAGFSPNLRSYGSAPEIRLEKGRVDAYIAEKIRDQVNGAEKRDALSYSQSLAVCLLKYNRFTDNELHFFGANPEVKQIMDYVFYRTRKGNFREKRYSLAERVSGAPLFRGDGIIFLRGFLVDAADNRLLDAYLNRYAGAGRKAYASPEKDREVIALNPPGGWVIREHMDAVYTLYALQLRYGFLKQPEWAGALAGEVRAMDPFRFAAAPGEQEAAAQLICYLSRFWSREERISRRIYSDQTRQEHLSMCFDPILQFDAILNEPFEEAYGLCCQYNLQALSWLFWDFCARYLAESGGL